MSQPAITIPYVQSDNLNPIYFTLLQNDGVTAISLASLTSLVFKAQHVDNPSVQVSGAMTVDDAAAGKCYYTALAADFAIVGGYYATITITYTGGQVVTFNNIFIDCQTKLPY